METTSFRILAFLRNFVKKILGCFFYGGVGGEKLHWSIETVRDQASPNYGLGRNRDRESAPTGAT